MKGALQGAVVRESSLEPVAGAYVKIVAAHRTQGSGGRKRSGVTDEAGTFSANGLAPGRWTVTLDFGEDNLEREVLIFDKTVSTVYFELSPAQCVMTEQTHVPHPSLSVVRGRVLDASDGRAVANATVMVVVAAAPVPDIAPLTDSDGTFEFNGLSSGHWVLRALAPDGRTGEVAVEVPECGETIIIIGEMVSGSLY